MFVARAGYCCVLAVIIAALQAAGCSGGGVGLDVQRPAAERPDITGGAATSGRFIIPAEVPFNVTSFKSGQSGSARGASDRVGASDATCRGEAREGGSAWGEFQIGYCLDNATGRPLQAVAKVKVRVKGSISSEEPMPREGARSSASNSLMFFIKDTYGLVLRQEQLFTQDLEKGSGATTASHDLVFDVRLEPDRGYYFVLSGRSEAQSAASQSVACSLEATAYGIDLTWQVAAPGQAPKAASQPAPASSPSSATLLPARPDRPPNNP